MLKGLSVQVNGGLLRATRTKPPNERPDMSRRGQQRFQLMDHALTTREDARGVARISRRLNLTEQEPRPVVGCSEPDDVSTGETGLGSPPVVALVPNPDGVVPLLKQDLGHSLTDLPGLWIWVTGK